MKNVLMLWLLLVTPLGAAVPSAGFAPELRPLFEALLADDSASLIGKEYLVPLRLKHVSDTHLIFADAYLRLDQNTTYQIGKWKFDAAVVSPFIGKEGQVVLVRFRPDAIHKEDPRMPYVAATILSLSETQQN